VNDKNVEGAVAWYGTNPNDMVGYFYLRSRHGVPLQRDLWTDKKRITSPTRNCSCL
jgi:hypothetical protein